MVISFEAGGDSSFVTHLTPRYAVHHFPSTLLAQQYAVNDAAMKFIEIYKYFNIIVIETKAPRARSGR